MNGKLVKFCGLNHVYLEDITTVNAVNLSTHKGGSKLLEDDTQRYWG